MEIHEAADIFPLDEESIPELAEDIRKSGLLVPIDLFEGKILDGRRRLKACELAGVEPTFREVSPPDPIAYAWSLNGPRRHLTPSQKGMAGSRMRDVYDRQAKERQKMALKKGVEKPVPANLPEREKGDTREIIAKMVGVGAKTIDHATHVLRHAVPEVIKAVDEGRMAVSRAAKLADEPAEVQRQEAAAEPPVQQSKSVARQNRSPASPLSEREKRQRGQALTLAQDAINVLRKIGRDNPGRVDAFRVVTNFIKASL